MTHPPLELEAEAAASRVGEFRRALSRWLASAARAARGTAGELPDDAADLVDDLVLATSEALENVVDHAFADADRPGTMRLGAELAGDAVTIVVADDGHWRDPDPGPTTRGRGLTLMKRLAGTDVDRGLAGTTVTLRRHLGLPVTDRPAAPA